MRTFVAIGLPDRLREQLETLLGELRRCDAGVRWVAPSSMHLTLKFLGEIQPRDLSDIDEVIRKIAASAAPTRARLRSMGSFPHLRRPRVIWIGLEPEDPRLTVLHSRLEDAFQEIGFPREKKGFRPHLTLGRVRSGRGVASLVELVESYAEVDLGCLRVDELTLFESKLTRQGAIYTALGSHRLGG